MEVRAAEVDPDRVAILSPSPPCPPRRFGTLPLLLLFTATAWTLFGGAAYAQGWTPIVQTAAAPPNRTARAAGRGQPEGSTTYTEFNSKTAALPPRVSDGQEIRRSHSTRSPSAQRHGLARAE
jgi:hypothetical protein